MASVQSVQFPADVSAQSGGSDVDPFLVEALQNPRHRLTILRMELDIRKFLQKAEQLQFEFPHFPTSYLRLAAHRVAQHYGLQTAVSENGVDGLTNKIVVIKTTSESKYPSVCLSDIPLKQPENSKPEHVKIAIMPRPCRTSSGDELGVKRNQVRTVEERMEEYDKVRARIFSANSPECPSSDETPPSQDSAEDKNWYTKKDQTEGGMFDSEKFDGVKDLSCTFSSRVAIFRDREKDRFDPDYDRNYGRYVNKGFPSGHQQPPMMTPFNMPSFQPPLVLYNAAFPQMGQPPQSSFRYGPSDPNVNNQFSSMGGVYQSARDAMYMQWPSPAMMYAHSYEPLRHAAYQPPFCQQPLSFDHSLNG